MCVQWLHILFFLRAMVAYSFVFAFRRVAFDLVALQVGVVCCFLSCIGMSQLNLTGMLFNDSGLVRAERCIGRFCISLALNAQSIGFGSKIEFFT